MPDWVDVSFDCLPLRSVGRLDVPMDASPRYQQRCMDIKSAMEKHGSHNSYYLYNAQVTFHLTNVEEIGMIQFRFEGTVLTDAVDEKSVRMDLQVELVRETCDWLNEPIVQWFCETVPRTVGVEFDRYVENGDLEKTRLRLKEIESQSDEQDGFMGMYL